MTTSQPPATVPDLLSRVTKATSNIAKHRAAMAQVAADAAAAKATPPSEGVKQS